MSPKLKLVYFDKKGTVEVSRLILVISGVEFEDYRYSTSDKCIEFENDKKAGLFDKSMGKLPYLEIKEKNEVIIIHQPRAIERFLAIKCNFMGKTDIEEARIDSICESIRDIADRYRLLSNYQQIKKDEHFFVKLKEEFIKLAGILDTVGPHADCPYAVGGSLSLADICFYCLITVSLNNDNNELLYSIVGNIPKLRNIMIKISSIKSVREWTTRYPV